MCNLVGSADSMCFFNPWFYSTDILHAGASMCFFYIIFSVLASRYNVVRFRMQIRGLDLRDLSREQFDQFGRLVDRSFQIPRELQDMRS